MKSVRLEKKIGIIRGFHLVHTAAMVILTARF